MELLLWLHTKENSDLISYLLIGSLFFSLSESFLSWQVGEEVKTGKISKLLLYPTNIFSNYLTQGFFRCFYIGLSYFPWMLILYFLYRPNLGENISRIWIFPVIFIISWLIRVLFDLVSGFLTFWLTTFEGLSYFNYNFVAISSGSLFPLDYLPKYLYDIAIFNPFAFTFYHPMQIYLGKYSTLETLYVFAGGITWCVVLYFLARWVFKMGLTRNEAVGL